MGLLTKIFKKKEGAGSQAEGSQKTEQPRPAYEEQLEELRRQHQVRLITSEEEGFLISELPNGVYGYSYAPDIQDGAPVFQKQKYLSFELHKAAWGEYFFIGFVTAEEARRLEAGDEYLEIYLYPQPFKEATTPVAISANRVIGRHLRPLRTEGGPLPLKVAMVNPQIPTQ